MESELSTLRNEREKMEIELQKIIDQKARDKILLYKQIHDLK